MSTGRSGDLSITALYTSQAWAWGKLPQADLLASADGRRVFGVTNFVLGLARLFRRDFIALAPSLLHRHVMIDTLAQQSGARCVLELAAGLSRRGATFSANPAVTYTELDLPWVIARKRVLLARTEEGTAVLARPNLRLVEGSVETAAFEPWAEPGQPLLVIAEGLLMYLPPDAQRALWAKVRQLAHRASPVTLVFDLVPASEQPRPGWMGRFLEKAMKAFTGGRAFERDLRTRGDILADLRAAGFSQVETYEPQHVAEAWHLPYPEARSQQLIFRAQSDSR